MFDYFLAYYVNRAFGIAYIITEITFAFCLAAVSNRIAFTPRGIAKFLLHGVGIWAAVVILASVFQRLVGTMTASMNTSVTVMPLVLIIYMVFFSQYKWKTRLMVGITFYTTFSAIMVLTEAIGYILRTEYGINVDMTLWSNSLLMVLVTVYLYLFNFDGYVFVPNFSVVLMCASAAVTFLSIRLSLGTWDNRVNYTLIVFCLLLLELLTYGMVISTAQQYGRSVTKQVLRDRKHGANDMLLLSRVSYDNMHTVLHDVRNQLATLRALLDGGRLDEARRFMDEFEVFASPVIEAVDCGNVVVDSAMAVELEKARRSGLTLKTAVSVPPVLAVSDSDLVSIVSNLVDNAIEACLRDGVTEPIRVEMRFQRGYLLLQVVNAVPDKRTGKRRVSLLSDKPGEGHGYGVRIVRDIAEKYNGMVKFSVRDGYFTADAMLAVPVAESEGQGA